MVNSPISLFSNLRTHFVFFYIPILLAFVAWQIEYMYAAPLLGVLLFLSVDAAHVLFTPPIVLNRVRRGRIPHIKAILLTGLLVAGVAILYATSKRMFAYTLGTLALYHVYKQQFGWLRLEERIRKKTISRYYDYLLLALVISWPTYFWLSTDMESLEKSFFIKNNLLFITGPLQGIPQWLANVFFYSYHLFLFIYFTQFIFALKKNKNAWQRFSILFSFWLVFYVPICVIKNQWLFMLALGLLHGASYIGLQRDVFLKIEKNNMTPTWRLIGFIVLFTIILHLLVMYFKIPLEINQSSIAEAVLFLPLLFHYLFDAIIWTEKVWE